MPGVADLGGLDSMVVSAGQLSTFVDKVLAATNTTKVDLLGHSQVGSPENITHDKRIGKESNKANYALTRFYTTGNHDAPLLSQVPRWREKSWYVTQWTAAKGHSDKHNESACLTLAYIFGINFCLIIHSQVWWIRCGCLRNDPSGTGPAHPE